MASLPVVTGAMLSCPLGMAPGTLIATPSTNLVQSLPQATIFDTVMGTNIVPFGLCKSLLHPVTAAQTAAASGVLTPGPCTPTVPAPWMPGAPNVLVGNKPALTMNSTCTCVYGGVITIVNPGTTSVVVP